ncbi:LysM domain protein [Ostertagia ostertagi]
MNYYYAPSVSQPDEHTFLCGYNKVRRYGTTQPPTVDHLPRKYINYTVKPDDTLQGIALKNDCSVSSIVRANKLWSMDALHLKTSIRIPIGNDSHRTGSARELRSQRSEPPKPVEKTDDRPQESMKDIFSRIDNAIKTTSTTVRKLERESTLDEIDRSHDECRQSRSRRQISLPKLLHSDYYNELS